MRGVIPITYIHQFLTSIKIWLQRIGNSAAASGLNTWRLEETGRPFSILGGRLFTIFRFDLLRAVVQVVGDLMLVLTLKWL